MAWLPKSRKARRRLAVIGLAGVVRHRRRLRARLARDGVVVAPLATAVRARLRGGSAYR